tara:strand:- start:3362 stop:4120 length:759 start_codon:yes stop_codon:yes gene_type:complete
MDKLYSNHHFVFVNGLHRSGTSILYRVLSTQSNFSGFSETGVPEDEGQHLQSVYKTAKHYGGPGRFGFDKRSYLTEVSSLISDKSRQKLFDEWSQYWDLSKQFLVEKSPPNIIRTRFLQAMYSNASFVTILRDPIAVSFATQKWSKTSLDSLFKHWLVCNQQYQEDSKMLKKSLLFKYEDFTSKTNEVLLQVSELLGESLELPKEWEVKQGINRKYVKMWERYKSSFWTRRMAQKLILKYEDSFNVFGYSLK